MLTQLAIFPKREAEGLYLAAVVDIIDDAVLFTTDSFKAVEDAIKAAQNWITQHPSEEL
jgi:hypothetical protein